MLVNVQKIMEKSLSKKNKKKKNELLVAIFQGASAWVRERFGSTVRSVEGVRAVGSIAAQERLGSAGERGGSAIRQGAWGRGRERGSGGQERGGSAVPGRSRSERGSGVRTGGGGGNGSATRV
jgi:hypothetical protein